MQNDAWYVYAKKIFFLKDLYKVIVNIVEEHGFIWKLYRYCNRVLFQIGKNETKEEVHNESERLVKILKLYFLVFFLTRSVLHDVYKKTCLSPSIFNEKKVFLWMDACMHDYAKEYRKHGVVKFYQIPTPFEYIGA